MNAKACFKVFRFIEYELYVSRFTCLIYPTKSKHPDLDFAFINKDFVFKGIHVHS